MNRVLALKIVALCFVCSFLTGIVVYASTPTGIMTFAGGYFPGSSSYTLFEDNGNFYAKNSLGVMSFSDTDFVDLLQSVIDTTPTGEIRIVPGTYEDIQGVVLKSNIKILGEDPRTTVLVCPTDPTGDMFVNNGVVTYNVEIAGLTFDGNNEENIDTYELVAVNFTSPAYTNPSYSFHIHDCLFKDWPSRALIISRTWYAKGENLVFDNTMIGCSVVGRSRYGVFSNIQTYNTEEYGFAFASADSCTLTGLSSYNDMVGLELAYNTRYCAISAVTVDGASWVGIILAGSEYNTITDFTVLNTVGNAVHLIDSGGYYTIRNTISGGTVENTGGVVGVFPGCEYNVFTGINGNGNHTGECGLGIEGSNNMFTDIIISDYNTANVYLNSAENTLLSNIVSTGCYYYGFWEQGSTDYSMIVNCWGHDNNAGGTMEIRTIGANTQVHSCFNGTDWVT